MRNPRLAMRTTDMFAPPDELEQPPLFEDVPAAGKRQALELTTRRGAVLCAACHGTGKLYGPGYAGLPSVWAYCACANGDALRGRDKQMVKQPIPGEEPEEMFWVEED